MISRLASLLERSYHAGRDKSETYMPAPPSVGCSLLILTGRVFQLERDRGKQPRDEWLTINGLNFHYRDWGGGEPGIILLHGLASTCHIWDLVAPVLAQGGHRVVAMDQRGHGASAKPDQGYDFEIVSRDLIGLIEGLGMERPLIIGHS